MIRGVGAVVLVAVVLALGAPARVAWADQAERARSLFAQGSQAYDAGRFDEALGHFREAYLVHRNPAFLFNMGVCLERLGRPHDAAEELRGYLRAVPDAQNRVETESRVRGLEEAQRLLDAERLKNAPPALLAAAPVPRYWTKRRVLGVVLGTIAIVGVGVGIGVGLGLGLKQEYPSTTLDTHVVTP